MKNVWIINQYLTTPQLNGDGHRHYYLAKEFEKKGYDVTLITSSFSHIGNRNNSFKGLFKLENKNIRTLLIKGNAYKGTQGVLRTLSWVVFSLLLFFIPTKKIPKPDIIIVSSISLLPIINVLYYFKKKFAKAKFILEIRDIWPLTLIEMGGFSNQNIFIKFLSWVEKKGYKKADYIVSLLNRTNYHIENVLKSQPKNYEWISNGFSTLDINDFEEIPIRISDNIPKDKFIVGYAGALGKANAMTNVIEALNIIKNKNICLCIVGEGNEKEYLKELALGNNNILFFDKIPKKQVQSFLNQCDLLYFGIQNLTLYKFGISMNKTFDYMYASKPMLLSAPVKNSVVEIAKCGSVVEAENTEAIKNEILHYFNMNIEKMKEIGNNGKNYLMDNFTYKALAEKYINIFEKK